MTGSIYAEFKVLPRKSRADDLVPKIRRCSLSFKAAVAANDQTAMEKVSKEAWAALTELFEILRNEQDQGRLSHTHMELKTGSIVNDISQSELTAMFNSKKIDKNHAKHKQMKLRDCLNKVAHHNPTYSDYRIDGRGAHYILLGGQYVNKIWFAEVLVSALCKNASRAIAAL